MSGLDFPAGFAWGVATAAYQIEGSPDADGKGESIWDRFAHTPGKIAHGDTGDTACDHYRRWRTDLDLLAELGVGAYRFSISWPRILPAGKGRPNRAGLDFYRRLIDGLLARGIEPFATLYHWDLPQALEDEGGWPSRETALRFQDYAACCFERLPGVRAWMTLNEPQVSAFIGYEEGRHAPGRRDRRDAFLAAHHLLLAHGLAVRAFRDLGAPGEIGLALNLWPLYPATDAPADRDAATRGNAFGMGLFLDPIFRGCYPEAVLAEHARLGVGSLPLEDLAVIGEPLDFLGINYYSRSLAAADPARPGGIRTLPPTGPVTAMGWEVVPGALHDLLMMLKNDYPKIPIYITENGAAYPDRVEETGAVRDADRLVYLREHLRQAHRAIADGADLRGYFVWSLLDNFEWAHGYAKRFGLFYTDYETQARIWKDSARWYQRVVRENAVPD